MATTPIEEYWQRYLDTLPEEDRAASGPYLSEQWGDSPEMASELGTLIASGVKTATSSALWEWEANEESLPEPGLKTIVLDGENNPLCIIETTEVILRAFSQVGARFAYEEGEGDRSLAYWREVHWRYFTRSLARLGLEPTGDMPLVCERFRVIFPGPEE